MARDQTTASLGSKRRPTPLAAIVRVIDARAKPTAFRLAHGHCRVGTAPTCDIVIDERTVSRTHAELALVGDGVKVKDLGSRNGTFYLDQRIESITLGLGARIKLGGVTLAIDVDGDALHGGLVYEGDAYRGMVGASPPMRRLFALLTRLEGSLVSVIVEGESGVGKEMVARALHDGSAVASGPFVAINCGAIPEGLVGSELFGHRRGAFTGALEDRRGVFVEADRGTLFLDEIGDLPPAIQPALLRVLETGTVCPVGSNRGQRVAVRIVAATHRDLEQEVAEGRFREDLFFRLAVVRVRVPALRERIEDIVPLARGFASEMKGAPIPESVLEQLKARPWSGNVRELRNIVQAYRALGVLPEPTRVTSAVLDLALRGAIDPKRSYAEQKDALVERFTAIYVELLLERTRGNQTIAAKIAGLDRGHFGKLVARRTNRRE